MSRPIPPLVTPAPRGVLWDLDGTILDSAECHRLSWLEILRAERVSVTEGAFERTFGQRNETVLRKWLGDDLSPAELARIADAKEARYRALLGERGVVLMPGVLGCLEHLRERGWRQALATSAPRQNVEVTLVRLGVGRFFDAVVTSEDVVRGKPDPQVFFLAAERLGVLPERCLVIEDSAAGIEAARQAHMRCIAVGASALELPAEIASPSLADLPLDAFEALLGSGTG